MSNYIYTFLAVGLFCLGQVSLWGQQKPVINKVYSEEDTYLILEGEFHTDNPILFIDGKQVKARYERSADRIKHTCPGTLQRQKIVLHIENGDKRSRNFNFDTTKEENTSLTGQNDNDDEEVNGTGSGSTSSSSSSSTNWSNSRNSNYSSSDGVAISDLKMSYGNTMMISLGDLQRTPSERTIKEEAERIIQILKGLKKANFELKGLTFKVQLDEKALSGRKYGNSIAMPYSNLVIDFFIDGELADLGKEFSRFTTIVNHWELELVKLKLLEQEILNSKALGLGKINVNVGTKKGVQPSFGLAVEAKIMEDAISKGIFLDKILPLTTNLFEDQNFDVIENPKAFVDPNNKTIIFRFSNYEPEYKLADIPKYINTIKPVIEKIKKQYTITKVELFTELFESSNFWDNPSGVKYKNEYGTKSFPYTLNGKQQSNISLIEGGINIKQQELLKLYEVNSSLRDVIPYPEPVFILRNDPSKEEVITKITLYLDEK